MKSLFTELHKKVLAMVPLIRDVQQYFASHQSLKTTGLGPSFRFVGS